MSVLRKQLFAPIQVPNAATVLYTAPALTRTMITKLTFTNEDTVAHTITVYLGSAQDAAHTLRSNKTIPPAGVEGSAWECFEAEGHMMQPGDALAAIADASAKVTAIGSGMELTQG